jgi:general secretion pathway protein M
MTMDLSLPTGRRGRLLALSITVAVPFMLWLLVAAPLADWYANRAETLAQRQRIAARMSGLVATLPELRRHAAAGAPQPQVAATLDGATDAIAAATLQQLVQDMAQRVGASLSSAETLPSAQVGQVRRIALRVTTRAPWPVLVQLLASVERATPRMLVDDLAIQGERVAAQGSVQPLDATLTVIAFRAATAPTTTAMNRNGIADPAAGSLVP